LNVQVSQGRVATDLSLVENTAKVL